MSRVGALHRSLLALGGTLAGLFLIEVGLRGRALLQDRGMLRPDRELPADPLPGAHVRLGQMIRRSPNRRIVYELRPDLRVVYAGRVVTTSPEGFRGSALGVPKGPGVFRIVGIGDSFLFGQGVGDDETHLARLGRRLEPRFGGRVETLNLAVPGYNAVMEVETLKQKGLRYEPDLVLIEFVGNDLDLPNFIGADPGVRSLRKWFLADFVSERLRGRRRGHVEEDRALVGAPLRPDDPGLFERDPEAVPVGYRDLVGWPAVEGAYRELHELGLRHGFRVALLRWGSIPGERRLASLARQLGFPTLNLAWVVEDAVRRGGYPSWLESPLVVSEADNHPSSEGHRVISEAVERFLVEERLVPATAEAEP